MARCWRLIAEYDAETTTYSAAAGAAQTSPYTPDFNGRMIGIRCLVGRTAATTLTDAVQFRLTCTTFNPNTIHVGCIGSGLQTAPAVAAPVQDWNIDQPVKAGVPITIEGRCLLANQVTNDILVFGLFDVG